MERNKREGTGNPQEPCCLIGETRQTYRVSHPRAFQSHKHEPFRPVRKKKKNTGSTEHRSKPMGMVCVWRGGEGEEVTGTPGECFLQDGCLAMASRNRGGQTFGSSLPWTTQQGVGLKQFRPTGLILPTSRLGTSQSLAGVTPLFCSLLSPRLCTPPHGRKPLPLQSPTCFAGRRDCQHSFPPTCSCTAMLATMCSKRV